MQAADFCKMHKYFGGVLIFFKDILTFILKHNIMYLSKTEEVLLKIIRKMKTITFNERKTP